MNWPSYKHHREGEAPCPNHFGKREEGRNDRLGNHCVWGTRKGRGIQDIMIKIKKKPHPSRFCVIVKIKTIAGDTRVFL